MNQYLGEYLCMFAFQARTRRALVPDASLTTLPVGLGHIKHTHTHTVGVFLKCSAYEARYQLARVNSADPVRIRKSLLQTVTLPALGNDNASANTDISAEQRSNVGARSLGMETDIDAKNKEALIAAHPDRLTKLEAIFLQGDCSECRAQPGVCDDLKCCC